MFVSAGIHNGSSRSSPISNLPHTTIFDFRLRRKIDVTVRVDRLRRSAGELFLDLSSTASASNDHFLFVIVTVLPSNLVIEIEKGSL